MILNEAFIQVFEELDNLTEAKADTQRLIDFAGEDLANRFLAIKDRLKSPENDLYYWIKNKTVDELEAAIEEIEGTKSNSQKKRDIADQGAELVCDSEHWSVYHITTFEASQKYGRDSQWCITGVNSYGDRYWHDYRNRDIEFYFFITKEDYDPRGIDSKFALALYPNGRAEIFNQQDDQINSLDEIPFYEEININGKNLDDLDFEEVYYCCSCDAELYEDDVCYGPDGDIYCEDCWGDSFFSCDGCGETFNLDYVNIVNDGDMLCSSCAQDKGYGFCPECDELVDYSKNITNIFGEEMCEDCFDDFLDTDRGYAEIFFHHCEGFSEGDFADADDVNKMIASWKKYRHELNFSEEEIKQYEKAFIENAKECDNVDIDATVFIDFGEDDDEDYISSYHISVEGTDKEQDNYEIKDSQALKEIITFINSLDQSEKDRVRMGWNWVDDDGDLEDVVVSIYGPSEGEAYDERTISNWEYAENLIRKALGLSIETEEALKLHENVKRAKSTKKSLKESYTKRTTSKVADNFLSEYKLYESMWDKPLVEEKTFRSEYARLLSTPEGREQYRAMSLDDRIALAKADREVDPVQKELDALEDFEFEYEGYDEDWYEDHFDPGSWYGHYQTSGTNHFPGFSYSVDSVDVFETLRDTIISKPNIEKVGSNELLTNYLKLEKAWTEASEDMEDELCEKMELYLAKNLGAFVEMFYEPLVEYYKDKAYEWASENLEPEDDYGYDYDDYDD